MMFTVAEKSKKRRRFDSRHAVSQFIRDNPKENSDLLHSATAASRKRNVFCLKSHWKRFRSCFQCCQSVRTASRRVCILLERILLALAILIVTFGLKKKDTLRLSFSLTTIPKEEDEG